MLNQQIHEEACEWFVRMRDGEDDPSTRVALMDWLRRSPEHVRAYLDVTAIWMELKNSKVDAGLDLATRIARARVDRSVATLIPQMAGSHRHSLARSDSLIGNDLLSRRNLLSIAASALIVCAVSLLWWGHRGQTYSTDLGEERSIALVDGSTVNIDSNSSVRVRFDKAQRLIELLSGQAIFRVAKDPAHPFVVRSADMTVRAIGTEFDVYRKPTGTVVTVLEGRVSVQSGELRQLAAASSLPVIAGEQVIVTPEGGATKSEHANLAAATAWTAWQLVFDFTPLSEVAAEFNRYNIRQLVIEGPQLRAFKVTAIFRTTDPSSLVRFVKSLPDVAVEEAADRILIRPEHETYK